MVVKCTVLGSEFDFVDTGKIRKILDKRHAQYEKLEGKAAAKSAKLQRKCDLRAYRELFKKFDGKNPSEIKK